MWRSVGAVLGVIIGSILLWSLFISAAWNIGDWVGGSHIPIPIGAEIVAFTPSIIDAAFGVLCICLSFKSRSGIYIASGGR